MRWIRNLSLVVLFLSCTSCGSSTPAAAPEPEGEESPTTEAEATEAEATPEETDPMTPPPPASEEGARAFARASNAFAIDLWARLRASQPGNSAVSPASIAMALAMTYAGARADTAAQMATVMHFDGLPGDTLHAAAGGLLGQWNDPERETYRLAVANRLFGEQTYEFEAPFLALTRNTYNAPLEPVDYVREPDAVRVHINGWVAERTNDRIENLLPELSIDADTRLVLTNAVYFLADWAHQFEQQATGPAAFHLGGGNDVEVPTMHQTESFEHTETDAVQVLQMRYAGDEMAMLVILPKAQDGLAAVEESLSVDAIDGWVSSLQRQRGQVSLPRVRIDPPDPLELSATLRAMGMTDAFDAEAADFTAMADPPNPTDRLYISEVFHKAFVAVDEEGTEAAAATAVVVGLGGGMPSPPEFTFEADHPFLFVIRDLRSGTILFLGRVADPS